MSMNEKAGEDELRTEIEHGNFERAAILAVSLDIPEEEIQKLRLKALWQMSAVYRNAPGTKRLAQHYGISKEELRQFLEKHAEEQNSQGNRRPLEPCYDLGTGKYLSFEKWMDHFF
jgi:transcriptional regulator with AAA-type ATPase domain